MENPDPISCCLLSHGPAASMHTKCCNVQTCCSINKKSVLGRKFSPKNFVFLKPDSWIQQFHISHFKDQSRVNKPPIEKDTKTSDVGWMQFYCPQKGGVFHYKFTCLCQIVHNPTIVEMKPLSPNILSSRISECLMWKILIFASGAY